MTSLAGWASDDSWPEVAGSVLVGLHQEVRGSGQLGPGRLPPRQVQLLGRGRGGRRQRPAQRRSHPLPLDRRRFQVQIFIISNSKTELNAINLHTLTFRIADARRLAFNSLKVVCRSQMGQ